MVNPGKDVKMSVRRRKAVSDIIIFLNIATITTKLQLSGTISQEALITAERGVIKRVIHIVRFQIAFPFGGVRGHFIQSGVEFSHLIVLCIRCCVRQTNTNTNCIDSLNKHSIQCIVCFDLRIDSVDK